MSNLIDKDALVAYIKSSINDIKISQKAGFIKKRDANKRIIFFESILSFIDTLEVKEVDLEKEYKSYMKSRKDDLSGNAVTVNMKDLARHFYELGLNTKQTSEEIKIGETQIYLNDDGGEPPYDGKQWLDLSCTEYEIPEDKFKDSDTVEIIIRKKKGENHGYSH